MKNLKTFEEWKWNPFRQLTPDEEFQKQKKKAEKERKKFLKMNKDNTRSKLQKKDVDNFVSSTRNPGDSFDKIRKTTSL